MGKVDFVVGYKGDSLGPYIAKKLDCSFRPFRSHYYPEGAPAPVIDAKYKDIKGKNVLLFRRTGQLPDRHKTCRFLMNYPRVAQCLQNPDLFNAGRVDVLHPYFILCRQNHNPRNDKSTDIRERDAGKDQGHIYEAGLFRGVDRVLTFHPHFHREPGEFEVAGVPIVGLDAVPLMVDYARSKGIDEGSVVLSPDLSGGDGGEDDYTLAKEFAKTAGLDFGCIHAEREGPTSKKVTERYDAEGRGVLLVDDMATTLSTLSRSVENIDNAEFIDIYVVHPVLPEGGHKAAQDLMRGNRHVRRFVATDTIDSDFSEISIVPAVVKFYEHDG
jgi:phosphoribosylpyrophosphate synthetase